MSISGKLVMKKKMEIQKFDDVYILDNFLSETYTSILEEFYLGDIFEWEKVKDVSNFSDGKERIGYHYLLADPNTQFFHPPSRAFHFTVPMVFFAFQHVGMEVERVLKSRAFKNEPLYEDNDPIHIDIDYPHWVCLYYPHDIDGDTVLFKEKFPDVSLDEALKNSSEFTEYMRVSPKRGRAVLFDGYRFHCPSRSRDKTRIVVNTDVVIK